MKVTYYLSKSPSDPANVEQSSSRNLRTPKIPHHYVSLSVTYTSCIYIYVYKNDDLIYRDHHHSYFMMYIDCNNDDTGEYCTTTSLWFQVQNLRSRSICCSRNQLFSSGTLLTMTSRAVSSFLRRSVVPAGTNTLRGGRSPPLPPFQRLPVPSQKVCLENPGYSDVLRYHCLTLPAFTNRKNYFLPTATDTLALRTK